jgi:formate dehydrogenase iron-sulfur subunit
MGLNRRQFLQVSGAGLGTIALGRLSMAEISRAEKSGQAMLYDASKCVGCRACQAGCKAWNQLPVESTDSAGIYESPRELSAETWTIIKLAREGDDWSFFKHQCMHCDDASCVNVCPTGAAAHRGEFVIFDQAVCIGCGYCVHACPFNVPHRSEILGTARKCTFCIDRVSAPADQPKGNWTSCAAACPTGALIFGQRADLLSSAQERVEALKKDGFPEASLYGEKELGGLGVLSILTLPTEAYGLPSPPQVSTDRVLGQWASGLVAAGAVLLLPLLLIVSRRGGESDVREGGEE